MRRLTLLLAHLNREDVRGVLVRSGEPPKVDGARGFEAIGASMDNDDVVQLLFEAGGSRYLETLGATPVSWTTRVPNVGAVKIVAKRRGDAIEAELTPAAPILEGRRSQSKRPKVNAEVKPPERRLGREEVTTDRPRAPQRDREDSIRPSPRPSARPPSRRPSRQSEGARRDTAKIKPVRQEAPPPQPERTSRKQTPPPAIAIAEKSRVDAHDLERPRVEPRNEARPEPRVAPPEARPEPKVEPRLAPPVEAAETPFVPSRQLTELLNAARSRYASDLHLIAGRPPHFRVAGELTPTGDSISAESLAKQIEPAVPRRLRAQLERNGSCDFALELPRLGRFRVNVARQRTGLKACFRLIPADVPTITAAGLPPELEKAVQHHQGLIVITGPSGQGKTSTLAALVDVINETTSHHVITVEDPIEHLHPRKRALISQREIGAHTRSFASALKAALREDPDVIVVGELRDVDTVRMALSASETGHLVLGTMSTPSAARTIERLIDLFPPGDQPQVRTTLAGGLKLVVAQRLVPSADRQSRHVAVEILPGNLALWTLIREDKTFQIGSLMQRGRGAGITRLDDSLADLVRAGKVAMAEAQRVAEAPDRLPERVLHGGVLPDRPPGPPPLPGAPPPSAPSSKDRPPPEDEPRGLLGRAGALFRKNR